MTRFAVGAATDVGQVRTVNQDNTLVADNVFAVADGMGGHRGGEVASAVAVDALRVSYRDLSASALIDSVREANHAVVDRAQGDPELRGMGTTLCALARVRTDAGDEMLAIVNVGDSRAYLLKRGDAELTQITDDHSLVQQLVRQGQLSPDAAAVHPQRNILTRALGIDREVEPDAYVLLPVKGDRYLLCSDGLFNEVDERRIAQVLRQASDPRKAAQILVHLANDGGGRDNISVVVVDIAHAGGHRRAIESQADDRRIVDSMVREDPTGQTPAATMIDAGNGDGDPAVTRPMAPVGGEDEPTVRINRPPTGGAAREALTGTTRTADGRVVVERPRVDPATLMGPAAPAGVAAPIGGSEPRSRFTWRVALFLVVLVGIFGASIYSVNWVADNSYFVGISEGQVAIFRGRPGGLLWREPRVEEFPGGMTIDQVLPQFQGDIRVGKERSSVEDARGFIERARVPPTTATTTTTTTTVPPGLETTTVPTAPLGP